MTGRRPFHRTSAFFVGDRETASSHAATAQQPARRPPAPGPLLPPRDRPPEPRAGGLSRPARERRAVFFRHQALPHANPGRPGQRPPAAESDRRRRLDRGAVRAAHRGCHDAQQPEEAAVMAVTSKLTMEALLRMVVERGATDLHLSANLPPHLRLDDRLVAVDAPLLSGSDVRELAY